MIIANQSLQIRPIPNFLSRVWVKARFAIIVFGLLFLLLGGAQFSAPSIVILLALFVSVYSLRKKAVVYIFDIKTDNEKFYVEYMNMNESKKIEILLKDTILQKNHERAKYKGYYTLDIYNKETLQLTQHQLLNWDEKTIDDVINIFQV